MIPSVVWVSFYERSFLALSESLTMSNRCWILETWKSLPRKNARSNRQRRGHTRRMDGGTSEGRVVGFEEGMGYDFTYYYRRCVKIKQI